VSQKTGARATARATADGDTVISVTIPLFNEEENVPVTV
jgi:hypothetical protein